MTPEERERLIQRFYDGEVGGEEATWAQRMLQEDPEAKALLDSLQEISDSIKIEIAGAVAEEDFSSFWEGIEGRLPDMAPLQAAPPIRLAMATVDEPEGLASLEEVGGAPEASDELPTAEPGLVEIPRPRPWWQVVAGPLAGAAVAAAVTAAVLLPGSSEVPRHSSEVAVRAIEASPSAPVVENPDNSIEIEAVETEGPLVLVLQDGPDQPTIIWFVETSASSDG